MPECLGLLELYYKIKEKGWGLKARRYNLIAKFQPSSREN
jgi:hypothetical protein